MSETFFVIARMVVRAGLVKNGVVCLGVLNV